MRLTKLHGTIENGRAVPSSGWRWHAANEMARRRAHRKVAKAARKRNRKR